MDLKLQVFNPCPCFAPLQIDPRPPRPRNNLNFIFVLAPEWFLHSPGAFELGPKMGRTRGSEFGPPRGPFHRLSYFLPPSNKRGRPPTAKETHAKESQAAMGDAMMVPQQEPSNKQTNLVYTTLRLADEWIVASNQMGALPRVSNRGHKYVSVFYVYNANFMKRVPVKSRHRHELLRANEEIYKWCTMRGFKP